MSSQNLLSSATPKVPWSVLTVINPPLLTVSENKLESYRKRKHQLLKWAYQTACEQVYSARFWLTSDVGGPSSPWWCRPWAGGPEWYKKWHWTQGPVERQKEGEGEQGSQDCKGLVHQLRQCAWFNGRSPKPAGLGLNEHEIKLDSLNVADSWGRLRSQW